MTQAPQLTQAEKDRLLAAGGGLRQSLRRLEGGRLEARQVAELWAWAADLRMVRGLAAGTTIARYLDALREFFRWVNGRELDDRALALADFDEWARYLYTVRGYSGRWRTTLITAVRQFYRWRSDHGLGEDLARGVRGPKRERNMPVRYTPEQLQRLFGACPPTEPILVRDRAILAFLLATGARREECARLEGKQLELRERVCVVRFRGKGAKERDVSFEGEAVKALRAWLELRPEIAATDSGAVWLSFSNRSRGEPVTVSAIEESVARAAKRAHLRDWGVHRFRVTFATELYDAGVGLQEIRQTMGHESIETTERYIQVSDRRRGVRLPGSRQHHLMGTKPQRVPRWVQQKIGRTEHDA